MLRKFLTLCSLCIAPVFANAGGCTFTENSTSLVQLSVIGAESTTTFAVVSWRIDCSGFNPGQTVGYVNKPNLSAGNFSATTGAWNGTTQFYNGTTAIGYQYFFLTSSQTTSSIMTGTANTVSGNITMSGATGSATGYASGNVYLWLSGSNTAIAQVTKQGTYGANDAGCASCKLMQTTLNGSGYVNNTYYPAGHPLKAEIYPSCAWKISSATINPGTLLSSTGDQTTTAGTQLSFACDSPTVNIQITPDSNNSSWVVNSGQDVLLASSGGSCVGACVSAHLKLTPSGGTQQDWYYPTGDCPSAGGYCGSPNTTSDINLNIQADIKIKAGFHGAVNKTIHPQIRFSGF